MELDPVLLSRLQFAFVIAFHILLPAFTVGLAPLTIGLLLATGWILAGPAAGHFGAMALVGATVLVMTRTRLSPIWPVAAGALAGALGWA